MRSVPAAQQHLSLMRIAYKMLFHSKQKFLGMLISSTFAFFIIMQQPSIYRGVSDRIVAQINAIKNVDLWVMSEESSTFEQPTQFKTTDIYRIRSIPGVQQAIQVYRSWYLMKHLKTNKILSWELIGVDPTTMLGLPKNMLAGSRSTIYQPNSIIIDGYALQQFNTETKGTIKIGDKMLSGRRTLIVSGITKPLYTYMYQPKCYMLNSYIPPEFKYGSFILVTIAPSSDVTTVAQEIRAITHYDALTPVQFATRSLDFFRKTTPIIIIFIAIAISGYVIGLIIMWQIFSNFILTHLHQFGMLKMLGVSNALLIKMVLFQAIIIGSIGYIIGLILLLIFEVIFHDTTVACHLTGTIAGMGIVGALIMVVLAAYLSIFKVLHSDTIDLCRDIN